MTYTGWCQNDFSAPGGAGLLREEGAQVLAQPVLEPAAERDVRLYLLLHTKFG
jgi:hypothetical protein